MNGIINYLPIVMIILLQSCSTPSKKSDISDSRPIQDTLVSLENNSTQLTYSLLGGTLVKFQDKINKINPFSWKHPKDELNDNQNVSVLQGQYLSIGRWELPTPGEVKLGMPLSGEPANNWWKFDGKSNTGELRMNCDALLDGFSIERHVILSQSDPLIKVREKFTNDFSIGRPCSIVQHLILAAPFFDGQVSLNSNAFIGFNQELAFKNPCLHEYHWPNAFIDTLQISTTNLCNFSSRFKYTASLIFSDSIGWITIYSSKLKLLLGYAWKSSEYPWLHIQNDINYGKPPIQGISFGTSGMDERFSFEDRITTTFHNIRNFDFIDAKSSITKTWYCFLITVPIGFERISGISYLNDRLALHITTFQGTTVRNLIL
jgi:hypothetical protein